MADYKILGLAEDAAPKKEFYKIQGLAQETPEQEAYGQAEEFTKKNYKKMPDWLRQALLSASKNKKVAGIANKAKPYSESINEAFEKSGIPEAVNPIGSAGLGVAQGLGKMGASIANTPAYFKELATGQKQERYKFPDLNKYAGEGALSRLGFNAGEIAAPLLVPFGAGAKATSYAGKVGAGALSGLLTGEDESGSRLASTVIGGALPGAMEVGKDILKLGKKSIAKDVVNTKQMLSNKYSKGYEGFKNAVQERGANEPHLDKLYYNKEELNPWLTKEAKAAIAEFNKHPSVNQAHQLQSDLFKTASELKSTAKDFISKQRLKEVNELRDTVRERMQNHLVDTGNTDLAMEYNQLTQGYKQDVAPYLRPYIDQMEKDIANGDSPADAVNKMLKDNDFIKKIKGSHPGLSGRASLQKMVEAINPIRHLIGR